jgi:hypothetical protein
MELETLKWGFPEYRGIQKALRSSARCVTLPRARWRAHRPCSGVRAAPRAMGTTHSGGVLASFLLWQVGVCVGVDRCGVRCWTGLVFAMSQVRRCMSALDACSLARTDSVVM